MMLEGTLCFDYKTFQVTDGVNWYYTIAPSLLFRLCFKKATRPCISGRAWLIKNIIIWHKKDKYIYRYKPIKEEDDRVNAKRKGGEINEQKK